MFYVKEKNDSLEVKVELTDENIFCQCAGCGKELRVDLSRVFAEGGDLFSTSFMCRDCIESRLSRMKFNDLD